MVGGAIESKRRYLAEREREICVDQGIETET